MKPLLWHRKAKETISNFPDSVKKEIGFLFYRLQMGDHLTMPHASPMRSVAVGVHEVRVRGEDGIYRVFYFTKHEMGIFVFHAFIKKTQKTPIEEILKGKQRLNELLEELK